MSVSRRERILLFIALYVAIAFCFMWFLYLPQQARIHSINANQQQLLQEKNRLTMIRKKQERTSPVSAKMVLVEKQLPSEQEMIPVLKFLNDSTGKCAVTFSSLDYRGAKDDGEAKTLTFGVGTRGSIFDLIDFLQELIGSPRFISVAEVSLSACKAEKSESSEEAGQPTYYIAPPDIPQAKLQRIKVEVEGEEAFAETTQRVADSFVPDQFEMKLTINAYYSPPTPDKAAEKTPGTTDNRESGGRI